MHKINPSCIIGIDSLCSKDKGRPCQNRNEKKTVVKPQKEKGFFKKCASCHRSWVTRDSYLRDPQLRIVGYQANFATLELGTFMFSHLCGTTMSISAYEFVDLYTGQIFKKRATGSRKCPRYCLDEKDLKYCEMHCECAYIRKVALIIQHWPKANIFGLTI